MWLRLARNDHEGHLLGNFPDSEKSIPVGDDPIVNIIPEPCQELNQDIDVDLVVICWRSSSRYFLATLDTTR